MAKDQDLLQAVKAKDLGSARKLLPKIKAAMAKKGGKKYNVNIQDEDGFTVLHHAALAGISDVTMSLIDMGCNINATDNKGMCPLHLAAWAGKVEVARLLLEAKAEVNFCSDNGVTALQLACQHGNVDVAEVLLDNGGDPTVINNTGEACLDLACRFGHTQVVELLLKSSSVRKLLNLYSINPKNSQPPLHLACKTGHVEIVRMLLEAGADMDEVDESGSCLHEAALYGKTEVVKLLLDWGIDTAAKNKDNQTAEEVVHRFTSSSASKEIKELLKEATQNKSTYAKAIKDHMNFYDPACLIFRAGNTIEILEQNEDGRWKGRIQGEENVGYFPSNFVKLQSPRKRSSTRTASKEAAVLPTGSFELVALAPVPTSQGFQRNRTRLSSFGKLQQKSASSSLDDTEQEPDANANRASAVNGIKQKGSVKQPAQSLQYVEVAVDSNSPPAVAEGVPFAYDKSKTQYAEVVLRGVPCSPGSPNGQVEEVNPLDEPPALPGKEDRQTAADGIWVRNPAVPTLPPKARARSKTPDNFSPSVHPAPQLVPVNQPARISTPELIKKEAVKPATPELSRKAYEIMNAPTTASPSPQVSGNSGSIDSVTRRLPEKSSSSYENVELKGRAPQAQSMFISDVDRGEPEGYVVVNQRSHTVGASGYENVIPSGLPVAKKHSYENVAANNLARSESYENMGDSQFSFLEEKRQSAGAQQHSQNELSDEQGEGLEYVTMKRGADGPHHYINLKSDGMPTENPSSAKGSVTLSMRDYNVLYDWLERNKLALYIDNFVKGGFDIISVRGITPEDLSAIDVVKTGHRKKLLSEAASLEPSDVFPKEKPPTIMNWLKLIGMEQYIPQFIDGGFDDMDFVQDVTVDDLDTIGVTKPGHRRKLWMAVNALAKDPGTAAPADNKREEDAKCGTPGGEATKADHCTADSNGQEKDKREGVCELPASVDPQEDTTKLANAKVQNTPAESSLEVAPAATDAKTVAELDCSTGSSDDQYSSSGSNISVIEVAKPLPTSDPLDETQDTEEAVEVPPLNVENPGDSNEAASRETYSVDTATMLRSEAETPSPGDHSEELPGDGSGSESRESKAGKCEKTQMKIQTTQTTVNNNNTLEDSQPTAAQPSKHSDIDKVREAVISASQSVAREPRAKPAPPAVKPKSFKKPPPRVPPKPRSGSSRGASFSKHSTCPVSEAETGLTGESPQHGGDLGVQIKNVLRRNSTEELSSFHSGPSSDFSSEGSGINIDFTSGGEELEKGEKEKDLGDDLINDINNLLTDISSELDAIC